MIGLFSLIRGASYRSGWEQGFAAGQTVDEAPPTGEDVPPAASRPYHGPRWGWGGGIVAPFFWIMGGFFKVFFFLFLFGMLFKLFRFGRWRRWHHHNKEWKHHHGHTPPWYDDSGEEPVMKA